MSFVGPAISGILPAHEPDPPRRASRRIAALQERLRAARPPIDAAVLVQNVDVYYFAGTFQTCHLLVPAQGIARLLVRKVLERAEKDSPLDDVRPMNSLRDLPGHLREVCWAAPSRVGFELDVLPAKTLDAHRGILGKDVEAAGITEDVLDLRSTKSDWEVERIRVFPHGLSARFQLHSITIFPTLKA
jgi:Xaa-Pro dipeptidase